MMIDNDDDGACVYTSTGTGYRVRWYKFGSHCACAPRYPLFKFTVVVFNIKPP